MDAEKPVLTDVPVMEIYPKADVLATPTNWLSFEAISFSKFSPFRWVMLFLSQNLKSVRLDTVL